MWRWDADADADATHHVTAVAMLVIWAWGMVLKSMLLTHQWTWPWIRLQASWQPWLKRSFHWDYHIHTWTLRQVTETLSHSKNAAKGQGHQRKEGKWRLGWNREEHAVISVSGWSWDMQDDQLWPVPAISMCCHLKKITSNIKLSTGKSRYKNRANWPIESNLSDCYH